MTRPVSASDTWMVTPEVVISIFRDLGSESKGVIRNVRKSSMGFLRLKFEQLADSKSGLRSFLDPRLSFLLGNC